MAEYLYFLIGLLILPGIIYGVIAQINVSSTFNKFENYDNIRGLTSQEVALKILNGAGITDVKIQTTKGHLTDHYDPRNKTLNLSESTYNSKSVSAIGVAAHEAGHAIQHHEGYRPLVIRNWFVPIVNFASRMFWVVFLVGFLMMVLSVAYANIGYILIWVSVAMYGASTLFYLITVPVEYNASNRAIKQLSEQNILDQKELGYAKKVLSAAAQTYVSSLIVSALYFLRFLLHILIIFRHDD